MEFSKSLKQVWAEFDLQSQPIRDDNAENVEKEFDGYKLAS